MRCGKWIEDLWVEDRYVECRKRIWLEGGFMGERKRYQYPVREGFRGKAGVSDSQNIRRNSDCSKQFVLDH